MSETEIDNFVEKLKSSYKKKEVVNKNDKMAEVRHLLELILTALIVLKIGGHITWSWWWIFTPLWIPAGLAILFGLVYLLIKLRKSK